MLIQCGYSRERNNAAAHNAKFMGRNLTGMYKMDEIFQRIEDNSFKGLYTGDFFDIEISTEFTARETVRCILAHFNYYWMTGDTAFVKPHVVIVPKNCFTVPASMNETDTTEGGYQGAYITQNILGKYITAINEKLNNHVLIHRDLSTNAINTASASMGGAGLTGASNSWQWANSSVSLMSEVQVYGTTVCSSSFYDTGVANRQLALFQHDPTALACKLGGADGVTAEKRTNWWLRDVASASAFSNVGSEGGITYGNASSIRGIRPIFCIG